MRAKDVALVLATLVAALALPTAASAYPVMCRDGTMSDAGGKQGACSHHGGVAGGAPSATTPSVPSPTVPAPVADVMDPTVSFVSTLPVSVQAGSPLPGPMVIYGDDRPLVAPASLLVDWGDGVVESVAITATGSLVTLPTHVYVAAGSFTPVTTITDAAGKQATAAGAPVTVTPLPPASTSGPVVTGTPAAKRLLTCSPGAWSNDPTSIEYQWRRNGQPVSGAVASTFAVRTRDAGALLSCTVKAANVSGSATASSNSVRISRARPAAAARQ
jgi:hypothetical protein